MPPHVLHLTQHVGQRVPASDMDAFCARVRAGSNNHVTHSCMPHRLLQRGCLPLSEAAVLSCAVVMASTQGSKQLRIHNLALRAMHCVFPRGSFPPPAAQSKSSSPTATKSMAWRVFHGMQSLVLAF